MQRRHFHRIGAASLLAAAAPWVRAQAWPARPIKVVVPYPAGSGVDGVARTVVSRMAEGLGQPIVIANRAGARGRMLEHGFVGVQCAVSVVVHEEDRAARPRRVAGRARAAAADRDRGAARNGLGARAGEHAGQRVRTDHQSVVHDRVVERRSARGEEDHDHQERDQHLN